MNKPREFWVAELPGKSFAVSTVAPRPPSVRIHVREVVPIDWEKVWGEYKHEWDALPEDMYKFIQQLVEKALIGEL